MFQALFPELRVGWGSFHHGAGPVCVFVSTQPEFPLGLEGGGRRESHPTRGSLESLSGSPACDRVFPDVSFPNGKNG